MTDQPPSRRKIHFHIGAHKTASSFLASNLRACEAGLSQQGLGVVLRKHVFETPFAQEVIEVAHGTRAPGVISPAARKSLRELLARKPGDVLVANEDLLCRLNVQDFYQNIGAAVRHIRAMEPEAEARFILYIRRQSDYLESVYMQFVQVGRALKFPRFMKRAASVDLSWLRIVEDLADAAGRENIAVRPFETIRDGDTAFLQDFLRLCGVSDPEAFSVVPEAGRGRAANRSYGDLGMRLARRANPLLETKKERRAFRKFLQENFSTATHPRAELLSLVEREEIQDRYASSNQTLFARFDLGADGAALGYY